MKLRVLLDTGPLVAFLDKDDEHHAWAVEQFARVAAPLVTCEAVLTEAFYLLRHHPPALDKLGEWVRGGMIEVRFQLSASRERTIALMQRYASVPMPFADACLFCMAEQSPERTVFTLDSHFVVYRLANGLPANTLRPPT